MFSAMCGPFNFDKHQLYQRSKIVSSKLWSQVWKVCNKGLAFKHGMYDVDSNMMTVLLLQVIKSKFLLRILCIPHTCAQLTMFD